MYPFTVRADPGRAVTDAPLVLFKTFRADLKATGTTPAKGLFSLAAMACVAVFSTQPSFATFFR